MRSSFFPENGDLEPRWYLGLSAFSPTACQVLRRNTAQSAERPGHRACIPARPFPGWVSWQCSRSLQGSSVTRAPCGVWGHARSAPSRWQTQMLITWALALKGPTWSSGQGQRWSCYRHLRSDAETAAGAYAACPVRTDWPALVLGSNPAWPWRLWVQLLSRDF